MRDKAAFFITGVVYLAILYALVRPGSKGTVIIASLSSALSDLIRGVAGQTYDTSTGKWS